MSLISKLKIFLNGLILTWMMSSHAIAGPKVVVTLKPIHSLVASVMEGIAVPELLLPDGSSPHTFSLKPSTFKLLHDADIIIWVGPSLETFMAKALAANSNRENIVTLESIPKLHLLPVRHGRDWTHPDPHDDDNAHQDHTHVHPHDSFDPHIWLSTQNAILIVNHLAQHFAKVDPAHAVVYLQNAKRTQHNLEQLKNQLNTILAGLQTVPFLVYHDGYQYFEKEFNLFGAGTMVVNPHLPLSGHGLKTIQNLITQKNIICVFRETEFNDASIYQSLKNLDVKVAELDPLGTRIPAGPANYEKTMLEIANTMKACLTKQK